MSVVYVCECTHQKPRHAGGRYACQDCSCKGYTPDFRQAAKSLERDLAELEATDPAVAEAAAQLDETTATIVEKAQLTNPKCPCGDFRPGDPSDVHSVVHTRWLHRSEPGTSVLGESTSARLRRVEQELVSARTELEQVRRARNSAYAANSDLLDELDRGGYSGWIVARDGGRTCTACDRDIRRGEAYTTDTTRDAQRHVHCPEVTP